MSSSKSNKGQKLKECVVLIDGTEEDAPTPPSTPVARQQTGPNLVKAAPPRKFAGCRGKNCKEKGCRALQCPKNSWNLDNVVERLEKEVLPSIFAPLSEDQLVKFDVLDFKAKVENGVKRFLTSMDEKAEAIAKKRRKIAKENYIRELESIGRRHTLKFCPICLKIANRSFRKLGCGHYVCHKCADDDSMLEIPDKLTREKPPFFELKCPLCRTMHKWDVPLDNTNDRRIEEDAEVAFRLQAELDEDLAAHDDEDHDPTYYPTESPANSPTSPIYMSVF